MNQAAVSDKFTPISLERAFNARREELRDGLRAVSDSLYGYGRQVLRGMPFELGAAAAANVILLDKDSITVELNGVSATYLIFLHAVEDAPPAQGELANQMATGNDTGAAVAEYVIEFADGSTAATPIRRRGAIQQSRIRWGASPFLAVPAHKDLVYLTTSEAQVLGRTPAGTSGRGELRHRASRDAYPEQLWLFALPVEAGKSIERLHLRAGNERVVIYGLTATQLEEHPLRLEVRQKARITLPPGAQFNVLNEAEGLEVDLGQIISAYRALDYEPEAWTDEAPEVQPRPAENAAILEYAAHPAARLHADGNEALPFDELQRAGRLTVVPPSDKPVRLRVVDKATGQPVACRLHLHGTAGEYLPPHGHHRKVNGFWFEDNYAEFVNGHNQYSYIPGECLAYLPLGQVYVEASRGYEYRPHRGSFQVEPGTETMTVELERSLNWREAGWVTADTHVHFLSPQTALLEGEAEGVNVVNLLASQWGEMFSNVGDFDGRTTLGAREFGGKGEFLVRVGTENRQQVMGHISLLGYSGAMIQPLCTGGASESAVGDPLEVTMAAWAEQCIQQGGLVVMPHAPDPQGERAADVVLGLVHAIEMMSFNPYDNQVSPVGLADWYRFLNLGYHLPVVGGSDKMAAAMLLGGIRTYAHLGEREFTYENWKRAVRGGNTFATVGPLVEMSVEGKAPGRTLGLPAGGGTVEVAWRVESANVPVRQVEIVSGGRCVESMDFEGKPAPFRTSGTTRVKVTGSTWLALRVRGSYHRDRPADIAAHSSAVQVLAGDAPVFAPADAEALLAQIEGVIDYVNVLAPRADAGRHETLRATLMRAHGMLHQRLHELGVAH